MTILKAGSVNTTQEPKIEVNFFLKPKISEVGGLCSEFDPGPTSVYLLCRTLRIGMIYVSRSRITSDTQKTMLHATLTPLFF